MCNDILLNKLGLDICVHSGLQKPVEVMQKAIITQSQDINHKIPGYIDSNLLCISVNLKILETRL